MVNMAKDVDDQRSIFVELETKEQVLAYVESLIHEVVAARQLTLSLDGKAAEIITRSGLSVTAQENLRELRKEQIKAKNRLMVQYGRVIGTLETLMHCRRLTAGEYQQLKGQAMATLLERTIIL